MIFQHWSSVQSVQLILLHLLSTAPCDALEAQYMPQASIAIGRLVQTIALCQCKLRV